MNVEYYLNGIKIAIIENLLAVPQPGHEVWIDRRRFYVSDVPRWVHVSGSTKVTIEIELTEMALRD